MGCRLLVAVLLTAVVAACGGSARPAEPPLVVGPSSPATTVPETLAEPPAVGSSDIEWTLTAALERYAAPGALAVIAVGDDRSAGWVGTADIDGTPIAADTRFRIASITKPITATLVLDAVRRGELALDDRVDDLVPGLLAEEPPVTVRMLLDHTSGIFDEINSPDILAEMRTPTEASQGTYGLGLAVYHLTCGTFYGHEGGMNGMASIALVSEDGAGAVVVAINLRDGTDPGLPALADDLLCPSLRAAR